MDIFSYLSQVVTGYLGTRKICKRTDRYAWYCNAMVLGGLIKSCHARNAWPIPLTPANDETFNNLRSCWESVVVPTFCHDTHQYETIHTPTECGGFKEKFLAHFDLVKTQQLDGLDLTAFRPTEED